MPKYFLQIFGCAMNYSDAERIASVLTAAGWEQADEIDAAELCLFVTCSVKQKAEDKVFGQLAKLAKWKAAQPGRQIGLTGCMVRQTSKQTTEKKDTLLQRSKLLDFVWRIEDTADLLNLLDGGESASFEKTYFSIPPARANQYQVTVPIMTGCDNWCSYCVVPLTRGREVSRDEAEILAECKQAVKHGAGEITLLGQNVNSYGKEPGRFARLLEQVAQIPKLKRLRFTSSHPKDFDENVIAVMAANPVIERHLHLPAQHGDDEILRRMNRGYTAAEYLTLVEQFRKKLPTASVTTDLIVGFPGETDTQFDSLLRFYEKAAFDFVFFSQYSPRPGTAAAKLPEQIPAAVKSARWHIVNELLKKITGGKYAALKDQILEVLVEKCQNGSCEGRSSEFYLVKFPGSDELVGQLVQVKITEPRMVELLGEVGVRKLGRKYESMRRVW
jgi:tRNA-2-methylthio-N6-dimethylallyladenosine synthase